MIHFIHKYKTIIDTYKHHYQECVKCGRRRIIDRFPGVGHQPIDRNWLEETNGNKRHKINKSRVLGYSENQKYPYHVEIK